LQATLFLFPPVGRNPETKGSPGSTAWERLGHQSGFTRVAECRLRSEVGGMDATDHQSDSTLLRKIESSRPAPTNVPTTVVIQEIPSRLYLSVEDFLTPGIEHARKFESSSAALEETTHLKLQSVQLVPTP
jgi:hypothetical protein